MTRGIVGVVAIGVLGLYGCAERIPEPTVIPNTPHISWVITTEREQGTEQMVCQSDPRTPCVVPATTVNAKRLATFHLYLHPGASDTKYTGTMQVGFFSGTVQQSKIDATVTAGNAPHGVSTTDIVTQRSGSYAIKLELNAVSGTPPSTQVIEDDIVVTVE